MAVWGCVKKRLAPGRESSLVDFLTLPDCLKETMTSPPGRHFCSLHLELTALYRDVFGDRWKLLDSSKGTNPKSFLKKHTAFKKSSQTKTEHLFLLYVCAAKWAPALTILVRSSMRSHNRCGFSSEPTYCVCRNPQCCIMTERLLLCSNGWKITHGTIQSALAQMSCQKTCKLRCFYCSKHLARDQVGRREWTEQGKAASPRPCFFK